MEGLAPTDAAVLTELLARATMYLQRTATNFVPFGDVLALVESTK